MGTVYSELEKPYTDKKPAGPVVGIRDGYTQRIGLIRNKVAKRGDHSERVSRDEIEGFPGYDRGLHRTE